MRGRNIDRDAEAMRTPMARACDRASIVGALGGAEIIEEMGRQSVEFVRNFLQFLRRPVNFGEL